MWKGVMETYGCGVGEDLQALVVWVGWRGGRVGRREGTSVWAEKDKQHAGTSTSQENARDRVLTKRRINTKTVRTSIG